MPDANAARETLALCRSLATTAVSRTRPSPQTLDKMRALRAEGHKWPDIARRFKMTVGQVRNYLDLCRRNPTTPHKYNPETHARARARRCAMIRALGISKEVYDQLLAMARAEAARTDRPLAEVRMEYGVPTLRQWDKIQAHLARQNKKRATHAVHTAPDNALSHNKTQPMSHQIISSGATP